VLLIQTCFFITIGTDYLNRLKNSLPWLIQLLRHESLCYVEWNKIATNLWSVQKSNRDLPQGNSELRLWTTWIVIDLTVFKYTRSLGIIAVNDRKGQNMATTPSRCPDWHFPSALDDYCANRILRDVLFIFEKWLWFDSAVHVILCGIRVRQFKFRKQ
jgi:hypothetical protein